MSGTPGQPRPAAGGSLGRYLPDGGGALVEVRLLGLPVLLLKDSREHHDGLMREFRLLALSGDVAPDTVPARLVHLTRVLGETYGSSRDRRDAELDAAIAAGAQTIDQVDVVPAAAGAAARSLAGLLEEADGYCRQMLLLTLPRPPLIRRFGDWYTGQYVDQTAGRPPVRWDGPPRMGR